jgi:hypothetical protein
MLSLTIGQHQRLAGGNGYTQGYCPVLAEREVSDDYYSNVHGPISGDTTCLATDNKWEYTDLLDPQLPLRYRAPAASQGGYF